MFLVTGTRAPRGAACIGLAMLWTAPLHAQRSARDSARILEHIADSVTLGWRFDRTAEGSTLAYTRGAQLSAKAATQHHAARDHRSESKSYGLAAAAFDAVGVADSALEYSRRHLEASRETAETTLVFKALHTHSYYHTKLGTADSARAHARLASDLAARASDRSLLLDDLMEIGARFSNAAERDSALSYYARALVLSRQLKQREGDVRRAIGHEHDRIGARQDSAGRRDSAIVHYRLALGHLRAGSRSGIDSIGLGLLLDRLIADYRIVGPLDSLMAALRLSATWHQWDALGGLAVLFRRTGQRDSALTYYTRERDRLAPLRAFKAGADGLTATIDSLRKGTAGSLDPPTFAWTPPASVAFSVDRRAQTVAVESEPARVAVEREVSLLINLASDVAGSQGNADSAATLLARARRLAERSASPRAVANVLRTTGLVYLELGVPDSSLLYLRAAASAKMADTADATPRRFERDEISVGIGRSHQLAGRVDSALVYYFRVLADSGSSFSVLPHIAAAYMQLGRPRMALDFYRRALGPGGGSDPTLLNGMASVYLNEARYDSALVYYRSALDAAWRGRLGRIAGITASAPLEKEDVSALGAALQGVSLTLHSRGQDAAALPYLRRAIEMYRERGLGSGERLALTQIGQLLQSLGMVDSARLYLESAARLQHGAKNRVGEADALTALAAVRARDGDGYGSLATYDSAAALLDLVAQSAGGDTNRVSLAERNTKFYEDWALAWLTYRPAGDAVAAQAALAAAEAGRGQALLQLMRAGPSSAPPASSPASLRASNTGRDLAGEGARLAQAVARSGTTTLYYLATADTLVAWLIRADGSIRVTSTPITRDSLAVLVGSLRGAAGATAVASRAIDSIEAPQRGATSAGAVPARLNELARLLLPPETRSASAAGELLIIPHGVLGLVPFAALPLDDGEPLGLRRALRYGPSLAAVLKAEASAPVAPAEWPERFRDALVVGNPTMPRVEFYTGDEVELDPLPGAEAEGRWVAQRLGAELLSGGRASEEEVRGRLAAAPLVHLATHGYAYTSDLRARDSFIALAPTLRHDGLLTVAEVIEELPPLHAELVVLSACQSGLGNSQRAEGTIGLQRAFLAKGARTVLVTLWNVSDEATAELMSQFYTHWLSGKGTVSKAEALRLAVRDVRSLPRFANVRYWGAFQLIGAP